MLQRGIELRRGLLGVACGCASDRYKDRYKKDSPAHPHAQSPRGNADDLTAHGALESTDYSQQSGLTGAKRADRASDDDDDNGSDEVVPEEGDVPRPWRKRDRQHDSHPGNQSPQRAEGRRFLAEDRQDEHSEQRSIKERP